jgi:hypothetical protein
MPTTLCSAKSLTGEDVMLIKKETNKKKHTPVQVEMVDHGSLAHYLALEGYSAAELKVPFGNTSNQEISNESFEDARSGIASVVRRAMSNYKKQSVK